MRTLCKAALALGLTALLAGPALAKPHHHHDHGSGTLLLLNKSVQQELKLDQGQIDQITAALKKVRDEHKDDIAKIRDRNVPRDQRMALATEVAHASRKAVKGILKPEQAKRFSQIRLQTAGVYAFVSPKAQKALKLTDAQKAEFKAIVAGTRKAQHAIFQSAAGKGREAFGKAKALRQEKMAAAMNVLTDEQKKAWTALTGGRSTSRSTPAPSPRSPGGAGNRGPRRPRRPRFLCGPSGDPSFKFDAPNLQRSGVIDALPQTDHPFQLRAAARRAYARASTLDVPDLIACVAPDRLWTARCLLACAKLSWAADGVVV